MLRHASAAMPLNSCAGLFGDKLGALADRLDKAFAGQAVAGSEIVAQQERKPPRRRRGDPVDRRVASVSPADHQARAPVSLLGAPRPAPSLPWALVAGATIAVLAGMTGLGGAKFRLSLLIGVYSGSPRGRR
jgi:hypothetical protein